MARLAPGRPKALTPVAGRPVIDHLIETFLDAGVGEILLLLGVGADSLRAHVEGRWKHKIRFTYSIEEAPRGTGGALIDALPHLHDTFFLCFGDVVFRTDLAALDADIAAFDADIMMTVHPNDHPYDSDAVVFGTDRRAVAMSVAPHAAPVRNRVNAGVYVMRRHLVAEIAASPSLPQRPDLEKHIVAPSLPRARIFVRELTEYLRDMGTPERLALAEADFAARVPEKLSDPQQRGGFFIALEALLDCTGSDLTPRPRGITLLQEGIQKGLFPVAMVEGTLPASLAELDVALGNQGAFVWDYVNFSSESPDSGFFAARRLVAKHTVFVAKDAKSWLR